VNPADPRHRPFAPTVLAEARRQGMGVVGMKVMAAGPLLGEARADELIRYAASIADTVIIGCSTNAEVQENLAVARAFVPMSEIERRALEQRIAPHAADYDTFKKMAARKK
jgi:predicted aldo/keto reductase-like oxidoreductase